MTVWRYVSLGFAVAWSLRSPVLAESEYRPCIELGANVRLALDNGKSFAGTALRAFVPRTTEFAFVGDDGKTERMTPQKLEFTPQMASQTEDRNAQPLQKNFPLDELSVSNGALHYPDCSGTGPFQGTLVINGGQGYLRGTVLRPLEHGGSAVQKGADPGWNPFGWFRFLSGKG